MPKKNNDNADVSKWIKPINVTVIIVALITGFGPLGGATAMYDAIKQGQGAKYDCSAEIDKAFDAYDQDPTVRIIVTGPVQDECKINEKVARYAAKNK